MRPETLQPDAQALYRTLQSDVRRAIDRCADSLDTQRLACPADPADDTTTLDSVLRSMLRGQDYAGIGRRLLMLLAEAARGNDAVALFTVERIATHYAAQQVTAMMDAGELCVWSQGLTDAS